MFSNLKHVLIDGSERFLFVLESFETRKDRKALKANDPVGRQCQEALNASYLWHPHAEHAEMRAL